MGRKIIGIGMKKLFVFLLFSGASSCFAAFQTDALSVTSSSITINGTNYIWTAGAGTADQCLKTDGGSPPTLYFGDCGTGSSTPAAVNYALLEETGFILLEDGTYMLLEK